MTNASELHFKRDCEHSMSQGRVLVDLAFVLGTLLGLKALLLQIPSMWTFAGPVSLLAALAVATWRLKTVGQTWEMLGLINTQSKLALVMWTISALVITIAAGNVSGALAEPLLAGQSNVNNELNAVMSGRFSNLPGNFAVYAFWLITAWIIGGFTEELLFRGFMIHRFEFLYCRLPFATVMAVVTQAIIFGQQHYYYQGLAGVIATGVIGLVSGLIYVLSKRRLWPLILSHGLSNTLGLTLIFLSNNG